MSTSPLLEALIPFKDFLDIEKSDSIRHEYYKGELFNMAGGTKTHNRIVSNFKRVLKDRFLPDECSVFSENVLLEVIQDHYYSYPDLILTYFSDDEKDAYITKNPLLVVEVLSESTEAHDRGFKVKKYQKIPSQIIHKTIPFFLKI
ncbi:MAG: Uma2 family endonuclease [Bacteroidetes bacterium]|nr:Uma2 family endonuclease [Bacteroidota bacterium]